MKSKIIVSLLMSMASFFAFSQCLVPNSVIIKNTYSTTNPTGIIVSYQGGTNYDWEVRNPITNALVLSGNSTNTGIIITGLAAGTVYKFRIRTNCGITQSSYNEGFFKTVNPSINIRYTDQTAFGYGFKHLRSDSSFHLPILPDTSLGRADTRGGAMMYSAKDSLAYVFNGYKWDKISSNGSGGSGVSVSFYGKNETGDSTVLLLSNGIRYTAKDSIGFQNNYCQGLLNGTGKVTWDEDLKFDVTPAIYCINNKQYSYVGGSITLDPADPDSARIDLLVLDTLGNLVKITGAPSQNPLFPQIDPLSQLYLTNIYVAAGATIPSGQSNVILWDENIGGPEWVGSASGITVNFNNTSTPYHLITSANAGAISGNGTITFTGTAYSNNVYNSLKFFIRLKSAFSVSTNISVTLMSGGVPVTMPMTLGTIQNFSKSTSGVYQNITIPFNNFTTLTPTASYDGVRFTTSGTNLQGFYLDYISFTGGTGTSTGSNYVTNVYRVAGTKNVMQVINGISYPAFQDSVGSVPEQVVKAPSWVKKTSGQPDTLMIPIDSLNTAIRDALIDSAAAIRADFPSGGAGGISELGTGYGLLNVNDSTYMVDTSGVIVNVARLNNALSTYFRIADSATAGFHTEGYNDARYAAFGSGINSIGSPNSSPSTNGASISSGVLSLSYANSSTIPGIVSTGPQTFFGAKTFQSGIATTTATMTGSVIAGVGVRLGNYSVSPVTGQMLLSSSGDRWVGFHRTNVGAPTGLDFNIGVSTNDLVFQRIPSTISAFDGSEVMRMVRATGNVLIGTSTDVVSSILTVNSTSQGSLPIPRMTTSQRTAIASPAIGLEVYDTDLNLPLFYSGTGWEGGAFAMGAIGSSSNANGATLSGGVLTLQPASTSFGGIITTGTQSFLGVKTTSSVWNFNGGINAGASTFTGNMNWSGIGQVNLGINRQFFITSTGGSGTGISITGANTFGTAGTTRQFFQAAPSMNHSSGTNNHIMFDAVPIINTTGGTNGVTGFNYAPTHTSITGTTSIGFRNTVGKNVFNESDGSTIIGGSSISSSAKLQIDGTTTGVLINRMTKTERNAIASPAAGLMVIVTGEVGGEYLSIYNANLTQWGKVNTTAD